MNFDAFVSYSHAADGRLAPAVQSAMQRLARPWYRVRALRVFRDEAALSANPHLWASIEAALDDSEWFVLLASPEAATSTWVDRELRHWLATKPTNRILMVLTDGTLQWDADGAALTGSAVPPAIVGAFAEEPRHVDLRWARSSTDLDLRNGRFRDAVAQLAAPAHGIDKDELESEDVRLHRRARRLARGATTLLVLLTVLSLVLGALAWLQRAEARREAAKSSREEQAVRRAEEVILARSLAGDSSAALRAGKTDLALLLAVEAERAAPGIESQGSLLNAIEDQPMLARQLHGLRGTTTPLGFSSDGNLFAAVSDHVRIWDLRTGQPVIDLPRVSDGRFADHGRLFVGASKTRLDVWDLTARREIRSFPVVGSDWTTSDDAAVLAAYSPDGTIGVWNLRTGTRISAISTRPESGNAGWLMGSAVALNDDGTVVAFTSESPGTAPTPGRVDTSIQTRAWRIAQDEPTGPGCASRSTASGSENALVSIHVLADESTVRTMSADPFGTSAFVATCNTESGRSTARPYQAASPIAGASADGHTIATRNGSTIQLINAADGSPIGIPERAPYGGWMVPFSDTVAFSANGRLLAASEFDGDVRIWRASAETALERSVWMPAGVTDVLPAGRGEIAVTREGRLFDVATRRSIGLLEGFRPPGSSNGSWTTVAASTDGRFVAALTANRLTVVDRTLHTMRTERVNVACRGPASALAISRSLVIVSCTLTTIQPVSVASSRWVVGRPVPLAHTGPQALFPDLLTFSPDGRTLAVTGQTGCCSGVELVDVRGMVLNPRPPSALERGVSGAFTPDSANYLIAHGDGEVTRVPVRTAADAPTSIALPGAGVQGILAVSPDGRVLATADTGNAVGLWDLGRRQLFATIPVPDLPQLLGSSSVFGTSSLTIRGKRLELDPTALEHAACAIANRNLTRAEAAQYLPGVAYNRTCTALP